jgi:hypothetical protein
LRRAHDPVAVRMRKGSREDRANCGRPEIRRRSAHGGHPDAHFQGSMRYAPVPIAHGADADRCVLEALAHDQTPMLLLRARLRLAHSEWLGRDCRVGDSQPPLRGSRDALDAPGSGLGGSEHDGPLRLGGEEPGADAPRPRRLLPEELPRRRRFRTARSAGGCVYRTGPSNRTSSGSCRSSASPRGLSLPARSA